MTTTKSQEKPCCDVFVSYAHADSEQVSTLVDALRAAELSVWFDNTYIDTFESITHAIVDGLEGAKTFLAYYSKHYPTRPATQWELTAAVTAVASISDPYERVMVVNPEADNKHIEPADLRDALYATPGQSDEDWCALAETVKRQIAKTPGRFGDIRALKQPAWFGLKSTGSTDFVGRNPELWQVHSALFGTAVPVITDRTGSAVVQIRGMGGVGKSLLALEYARRFGAAYGGGIFWLRALGNEEGQASLSAAQREEELHAQLIRFAAELGVPSHGEVENLRGAIGSRMSKVGESCLWIVDDLPSGLGDLELQRWFAPHPVAKTLLTTRSRGYEKLAVPIDVGVLCERDALALLTLRRQPEDDAERQAAEAICDALGSLALAIDVAGAALANIPGTSFQALLDSLAQEAEDELEFAAELSAVLPLDHTPSIARTLSRSIERLTPEGRDYLLLASLIGAAPIPDDLVSAAFAFEQDIPYEQGQKRAIKGGVDTARHSLSDQVRQLKGAREVHALVRRTMSFRPDDDNRRDSLRAAAVQSSSIFFEWVLADRTSEGLEEVDVSDKEVELTRAHAIALTREMPDVETAELLDLVTRYNNIILGETKSAETDLRRLIAAYTEFHGTNSRNTLSAKRSLVATLNTLGNHAEARELGEEALAVARATLREGDDETLLIMQRLATVQQRMGELTEAHALAEEAAQLAESHFGEEDSRTLDARQRFASIIVDEGEITDAIGELESILAIRRRDEGASHPATIDTMDVLSGALYQIGDFERAEQLKEERVMSSRDRLGIDHSDTLQSEHDLALIVKANGNMDRARAMLEDVCNRSVAALGEGHPDTWHFQASLAYFMKQQGDFEGGHRLEREILRKRHRYLSDRHPATLSSVNGVAQSLNALGKHRQARRLGSWLLQKTDEVFGEQHSDTTIYASNLIGYLVDDGADGVAIASTMRRYLYWLKDENPEDLQSNQRDIRADYLSWLENLEELMPE